MGVARAWSRSEIKKFLPSLSVNLIIYLQNLWSAMSLSLLVAEEKKLPISINFQKASIPCIYIYQAQNRKGCLTAPLSVTGGHWPHFNNLGMKTILFVINSCTKY